MKPDRFTIPHAAVFLAAFALGIAVDNAIYLLARCPASTPPFILHNNTVLSSEYLSLGSPGNSMHRNGALCKEASPISNPCNNASSSYPLRQLLLKRVVRLRTSDIHQYRVPIIQRPRVSHRTIHIDVPPVVHVQ